MIEKDKTFQDFSRLNEQEKNDVSIGMYVQSKCICIKHS